MIDAPSLDQQIKISKEIAADLKRSTAEFKTMYGQYQALNLDDFYTLTAGG